MTALVRGRYEPLAIIGRGGQGFVIHARDRLHDRPVALKVRVVGSDGERRALLGEARTLLGLRPHPGLPLVREDFFEGDRYYLAMDWVEGESLAASLAAAGSDGLPVETVLDVIDRVAGILDHLHAHDPPVVHRDVKPANIIRTAQGEIVLVDFGLSGAGGEAESARAGTGGYIAPEVAAGEKASPAADIFGIAATAFALLTGEPPRPGSRPRWRGVSRHEAAILTRAMERGLALDPERRPETAVAFASSLRLGPAIPGNLPAELTAFVGREREVEAVAALLGQTRLLTLTGPGGIGKTRLALRAAADMAERFPDGTWVADLAPVANPGLVAQTAAAALGARERPDAPPEEALLDHLAGRDLLLVLDNCEHLVEECSALAERILRSGPRVRILATSREPLAADGETTWRVPPMPVPDHAPGAAEAERWPAVRLLLDRARRLRPDLVFDDAAATVAVAICRRLDGLPLAIELAAARVRHLPLPEIAARLDDRFRLLAGGRRTAAARQQTLRATVDWSYEMLGETERTLLARLSIFAGSFHLGAAEQVCGTEPLTPEGVLDSLSGLVDRSLAVAEEEEAEPRYRLLETIRAYAAEHLAGAGETQAVAARHRDFFLGVAAEAEAGLEGPEQAAWLAAVDRDLDNLRQALRGALDDGLGDAACRAAGGLFRFWETRGYLTEGRSWLAAGLEATDPAPTPVRAAALSAIGALAQIQGDYPAAKRAYEQSLTDAEACGASARAADALHNLGGLSLATGDLSRARRLCEDALALRRQLGSPRPLAASLANLGIIALASGDHAGARRMLEECHRTYERLGDLSGVADALANLGVAAEEGGDRAEARARHEGALEIRRSLGDRWGIANSLANLAGLARDAGDLASARSRFEEALAIQRDLDDLDGAAHCLYGLGTVAAADSDLEAAAGHLRDSLALRARLGDRRGAADCLEELALLPGGAGPAQTLSLLGAAETLRAAAEAAVPGGQEERLAAARETARRALSAEEARGAWAAGRALDLEGAVALAASSHPPPPAPQGQESGAGASKRTPE